MHGVGRSRRGLHNYRRRAHFDVAGSRCESIERRLQFVQASDSHIAFNKPANSDVTGTLTLRLQTISTSKRSEQLRIARNCPLTSRFARAAGYGCRCFANLILKD